MFKKLFLGQEESSSSPAAHLLPDRPLYPVVARPPAATPPSPPAVGRPLAATPPSPAVGRPLAATLPSRPSSLAPSPRTSRDPQPGKCLLLHKKPVFWDRFGLVISSSYISWLSDKMNYSYSILNFFIASIRTTGSCCNIKNSAFFVRDFKTAFLL